VGWKSLVPAKGTGGSGAAASEGGAQSSGGTGSGSSSSRSSNIGNDSGDISGWDLPFKSLVPGRQKIVELLKQQLVQSMPDEVAMSIAMVIEKGMDHAMSYDRAQKEYHSKARQLVVNIKKNPQLRENLLNGDVDPTMLATMTVSELASEEAKERRKHTLEQGRESKQGDYFLTNQQRLLEANAGISADKQGSLYICRKCGSDRTTNYQLQTRSSDEPMTVFVTCMKCTHRYRC